MKIKLIFILLLASIHLYSKEYRWVLAHDFNDSYVRSYWGADTKGKDTLICGGRYDVEYPYINLSTNGGRNWKVVLIDSSFKKTTALNKVIIKFIFLGENSEAIAFADSGYVYRTENLQNWEKSKLKISITSIIQDVKQFKNTIIVSTAHELYKSSDFGKTWSEIYIEKQDSSNFKSIARLEIINENTYFATYFLDNEVEFNTYVMKTTDGGESWEDITQLPLYFNELIFYNENVGYGHRSTNNSYTQNIFKTVDGGKSWDLIYQKHFQFYNTIVSLDKISDNSFIFVSRNKELYRTTDDFKTVEIDSSYSFLSYGMSQCIKVYDGEKLFNPTNNDRIYIYTDEDDIGIGVSVENTPELLNEANNSLIFPNPSSEKISLDLGGVAVADLVVYDILGNEIMSIPNYTNKSEIDISTLSIGTYTIQLQTSTGSVSQRLLVNR